ncbi:MAG: HAMP domain-containing sensor histidine kinase [Balneola sp.]
MNFLKVKRIGRNRLVRWILLMLGLIAIIALTGMNVFSLYDIRERVTESESERQLKKAEEITSLVQSEIYQFFTKPLDLDNQEEASLEDSGKLSSTLERIFSDLADNPYTSSIYYTPAKKDPCEAGTSIFFYNQADKTLETTDEYSTLVCDGVGLIRSATRIQINNFDLRWRSMVEFDAHRSMNIGLINLTENRVIGYFTFILNQDAIVNKLIAPLIYQYFGGSENEGTVVWLHDHRRDVVLASNNSSVDFSVDLVDNRVRFPRFFSDWILKVAFLNPPITSAYQETFRKNIIVLGFAVLFLVGSLLFMFYTAQKERELSMRQAGFLANVTHELKTPLAVMQAAGENISDGRVTEPDRLKKYGGHIYDESIRLRKMIEKLLDVAKYDAGQTLVSRSPQNLKTLVDTFLEENQEFIAEKGFELKYHTEDNIDFEVLADPDSLETILNNLVENAIKYSSDNKKIIIKLFADDSMLKLSVRDHGVGIKRKELKNIFKKFYRVEESLVAKTKGHGLGLSIVRNLIILNEGDISVDSEYGVGTTFVVSFPKLNSEEI